MKTAIVTGASSGIGKALANLLAKSGFRLGLMARRIDLMRQVENISSSGVMIQAADFTNPEQSLQDFKQLWNSLGQVDYVYLNAGVSLPSGQLAWSHDRDMLHVNAVSFTALAGEAIKRFQIQGAGHLIGISSITGTRGLGYAPVYGATKAFVSNYLQGIRQRVKAVNPSIYVTDIRPGFVETAMIRSVPAKFWVSTPEKAARQIIQAVQKKKRTAHVSRRWVAAAFVFGLVPEIILEKIYARHIKRDT